MKKRNIGFKTINAHTPAIVLSALFRLIMRLMRKPMVLHGRKPLGKLA
nr:MAG TPA: hypothetical protein [Caudoviricetes sp.]